MREPNQRIKRDEFLTFNDSRITNHEALSAIVAMEGVALASSPAPEPLPAPDLGRSWRLVWSSDHPRHGAPGAPFFAASHPDV